MTLLNGVEITTLNGGTKNNQGKSCGTAGFTVEIRIVGPIACKVALKNNIIIQFNSVFIY
jgi:hypothetical protein